MSGVIGTLEERGRAALVAAFELAPADADPVVRRSPPGRGADYQANAALALAKKLGMKPRDVAEKFVAALQVDDLCESVEIAGPGFVNLRLRPEALAGSLADDDRLGVKTQPARTIVVDYSSPNVAKEMHVGHLRSTIIGDSLVRIHEFLGHRLVRHNHVGDWGTPFGMLIEHILDIGEGETAHELSMGDLDVFYKAANAKFNDAPEFADRARQRVVLLQSGDKETLRLWRLLVDESLRYFRSVYDRLGVTLTDDDLLGESFYNPRLDDMAESLEKSGLARVDDGALCVFPEGFTGREGKPLPLIIRKRDRGYPYAATDLSAVRYRVGDLEADRVFYLVDAGQGQHHLPMVFAVAESAGWVKSGQLELVKFGLVLGPDGQRLKSRAGESVKLAALLDEAVERAAAVVAEKSPDLSEQEASDVARAVGIGAIKYADLSNDRVKDYVFAWDRMLAMDGNTAPYLQYAIARIRSIFRRAELGEGSLAGPVVITEPAERELALALASFEEAVLGTAEHLQPHRLCTYLFDLASTFTTFYEHCPVLRAESEEIRASRLKLCDLTARTLALGLDLLGIESPQRM